MATDHPKFRTYITDEERTAAEDALQRIADLDAECEKAVDEWYSANYPFGVRMKSQDRTALARHVAQRLRPHLSRVRHIDGPPS